MERKRFAVKKKGIQQKRHRHKRNQVTDQERQKDRKMCINREKRQKEMASDTRQKKEI